MNCKNLFRNAMVFAILGICTITLATPTHANDTKSKATKTKVVATKKQFQCQHCKEVLSYAAAKAKNFQCCGMKMVEVKTTKKTSTKKKS